MPSRCAAQLAVGREIRVSGVQAGVAGQWRPSAVRRMPVVPSYATPPPESWNRTGAVSRRRLEPSECLAAARRDAGAGSRREVGNAHRVAGEEQDVGVGVALELGRGRCRPEGGDHHPVGRRRRGRRPGPRPPGRARPIGGLDPESLGRPPLERPADQGAAGEIFADGGPVRGPGLEHAGGSTMSTQSAPVCARSSSAWSSRLARSSVRSDFADPRDVRRHLNQRGRELAQASAPAHQRVADGGAGRSERPRRGGLGRGVRRGLRVTSKAVPSAATTTRAAPSEDLPAPRGILSSSTAACCGYGWPNLLRCGMNR